jgi:hypothetical protein
MSRPKVGKIDWQVLDQLPAIHGIQFFCDAMTGAGRLPSCRSKRGRQRFPFFKEAFRALTIQSTQQTAQSG